MPRRAGPSQSDRDQRLSDSEARLDLACRAARLGIWDWRLQTNEMVYSDIARAICGFPAEGPVTYEMVVEVTHPEDLPRTHHMAERALDPAIRERQPYEYRILRPDGEVRWVLAHGEAVFEARPDGSVAAVRYAGTLQDITEEKLTRAALEASEAGLRLAMDAARAAVWDYDVASASLTRSAELNRLLGFPPDADPTLEELAGCYAPGEADRVTAAARAALAAGRTNFEVEYRFVRLDGQPRWALIRALIRLDPKGVPTGVLGVVMDITERKLAELELAAREAELQALNATLEQRVAERTEERDRMWRLSRELFLIIGTDGVVRAVNPAVEANGFRVKEVVGHHFAQFVEPEDLPLVAEALARAAQGPVSDIETRLKTADGGHRWYSWVTSPEEGLIYAVGRDVTEERARKQALDNTQEALRQSQKMEAMGQLTGGVAHDFNNLLTPIIGSLDLLQRRGLGGAREQRLIDGALQSAERAKTLVQRLLAFARRQPLQPRPVDLGRLVREMSELIVSTCGPRIEVAVDVADDLPAAHADANQLEMALLNLAVNARDAMPDGGLLSIRVEGAESPDGGGRRLRLTVADTGAGMSPEVLARASEPFFSTKGVGQGTGLGLSMVHGLVGQLGGSMAISSREGEGTRVELWLPEAGQDAQPAPAPAAEARAAGRAGTAVLVDDEELVRASTADMLSELGYRVVEAGTAGQALGLIEELGGKVELVVTDHLMPGMTGVELARRLREGRPDARILIVSGYAEADGLAPDLPRLTKPFRQDDLAAAIARLD